MAKRDAIKKKISYTLQEGEIIKGAIFWMASWL